MQEARRELEFDEVAYVGDPEAQPPYDLLIRMGRAFYTPGSLLKEWRKIGASRRIPKGVLRGLQRNTQAGVTRVFVAHPDAPIFHTDPLDYMDTEDLQNMLLAMEAGAELDPIAAEFLTGQLPITHAAAAAPLTSPVAPRGDAVILWFTLAGFRLIVEPGTDVQALAEQYGVDVIPVPLDQAVFLPPRKCGVTLDIGATYLVSDLAAFDEDEDVVERSMQGEGETVHAVMPPVPIAPLKLRQAAFVYVDGDALLSRRPPLSWLVGPSALAALKKDAGRRWGMPYGTRRHLGLCQGAKTVLEVETRLDGLQWTEPPTEAEALALVQATVAHPAIQALPADCRPRDAVAAAWRAFRAGATDEEQRLLRHLLEAAGAPEDALAMQARAAEVGDD